MISITRKLEFDAGHRIPHHNGQCRNLHGHRYTLELTVTGDLMPEDGRSDEGMVVDFGDVKKLACAHLVDRWDHAFLVWKGDVELVAFLASLPDHKTVVLDHVPTVENLAAIALATLAPPFAARFGRKLALTNVRIYETPNCWADCCAGAAGGV